MSDGETKKRTSVRVSTTTLDRLEEYQTDNGLDNRSEAFEDIVANWAEVAESRGFWQRIAQQSMYAMTFALIIAVLAGGVAVTAIWLTAFPSPWAAVGLGGFFAALLVISGGTVSYRFSQAKIKKLEEVEA